MMTSFPGFFKLLAAFLFAIVLQFVPFYGIWIDWKPNFILVLTITLILNYPKHFGAGFASISGLCTDILLGEILGHFMFVFTLCGALVCLLARWAQYFALTYRLLSMFAICVIASFLQGILVVMQGLAVSPDLFIGAAIMSAMILPIYEMAFNFAREPE